jgi:anhydro-N-acetylmuramic acid kinase
VSAPFSPELRKALADLQSPGPNEIHRENQAANALAIAYADTVKQLLAQKPSLPQRILCDWRPWPNHSPSSRSWSNYLSYTHQTLNPSLLAELTGIDVIADFRSRDLAAGGHGAPLVRQPFMLSNLHRIKISHINI